MEPGGALRMVGGGGVGNTVLLLPAVTADCFGCTEVQLPGFCPDIALTGGEQPSIKTQHVPSHTLDLPCGQEMSPC